MMEKCCNGIKVRFILFVLNCTRFHLDDFDIDAKASWVNEDNETSSIKVEWKVLGKHTYDVTGFMIYLTTIPYKNYWNSTVSVRVDENTDKYVFGHFRTKNFYRISICPIYLWKSDADKSEKLDRMIKHLAVSKNINPIEHEDSSEVIQAPKYFYCFPLRKRKIFVLWAPLNNTNYTVTLHNEQEEGAMKFVLSVKRIKFALDQLWWHIKVQGGDIAHKDNKTYLSTAYKLCYSKIDGKVGLIFFFIL